MLKALEKLACTLYKHLVHVHVYVGLFLRGIFLTKVQSCPKSVLLLAENAAIQEI